VGRAKIDGVGFFCLGGSGHPGASNVLYPLVCLRVFESRECKFIRHLFRGNESFDGKGNESLEHLQEFSIKPPNLGFFGKNRKNIFPRVPNTTFQSFGI
jgi:hypothetical protein